MILGDAQVRRGLRLFAIGDIHGCCKQLQAILRLIDDYQSRNPIEHHKLLFLGDYVDRGPDNRGVIELLMFLNESDRDCCFLLGNHDERMLRFIDNPSLVWDQMMRWGGARTLESYGIVPGAGE